MAASETFVIVPRNRKLRGRMLANPEKIKQPLILTQTPREARQYGSRMSAYKFLKRHPDIARKYKYIKLTPASR